jgi:hypothetical protein
MGGGSTEQQVTERDATRPLEITDSLSDTRFLLDELVKAHQKSHTRTRERSLLITALQEAAFWALEGIKDEPL